VFRTCVSPPETEKNSSIDIHDENDSGDNDFAENSLLGMPEKGRENLQGDSKSLPLTGAKINNFCRLHKRIFLIKHHPSLMTFSFHVQFLYQRRFYF
jgi:hypothetical protein